MQTAITLTVISVSAEGLVLEYQTLPGNKPKTYGNEVLVFQGASVPWPVTPLASVQMPSDAPKGQVTIDMPMQPVDYVAAYAVGPRKTTSFTDYPNIACALPLAATAQPGTPGAAMISIASFGASYVVCNYSFLPGFQPEKAGSYAAIWQGPQAPFDQAPMARQTITGGQSAGQVVFNGVQVVIGMTYSVALFTTDSATAMAAETHFST